MKVVYKYQINFTATSVEMPSGAQILHAALQRWLIYIWALVDRCAPMVSRTLFVEGTGCPFDATNSVHVATFFEQDGDFVWHVFEEIHNGVN